MGGDGGSIPGRYDVVKVKGYEFKRNLGGMGYDPNTIVKRGRRRGADDPDVVFTICHLSEEPLSAPVCLDKQGYPYCKEKVVEALKAKTKFPPHIRIKRMRDVVQIYPRDSGEGVFPAFDAGTHSLQCQLTGDPCTLKRLFCFSLPCGCIYSSRALGNVKSATAEQCPVCGKPATQFPIIKQNSATPY